MNIRKWWTKEIWVPQALKKIDRYVLSCYPRIWSIRAHYIIFYGPLAILFAILLRQIRLNYVLTSCCLLIWLYAIMSWGVKIREFKVEREFGNTTHLMAFGEIFLYGLCWAIYITPVLLLTRISYNSGYIYGYIIAFNVGLVMFCGRHTRSGVMDMFLTSVFSGLKGNFSEFWVGLIMTGLGVLIYWKFRGALPVGSVVKIDGLVILIAIIYIYTFFVILNTIKLKHLRTSSMGHTLRLTAFPFLIAMCVYTTLLLVQGDTFFPSMPTSATKANEPRDFTQQFNAGMMLLSRLYYSLAILWHYALVATLSYLPLLPYIKKQYMLILALPKE